MAGALASAETLETTAAASGNNIPVTPAHMQPKWEYGPFINYGNGLGIRSDYRFLSAGVQLGKRLTPVMHAGSFELGGNIMPLWQAYTPAPGLQDLIIGNVNYGLVPFGGGTYRGGERYAGDFPLELSHLAGSHSAVGSGRGRGDLYDAQVSTGRTGCAWDSGRDVRVELFVAGRRRDSHLHAGPAVNRYRRERGTYLLGFAG